MQKKIKIIKVSNIDDEFFKIHYEEDGKPKMKVFRKRDYYGNMDKESR